MVPGLKSDSFLFPCYFCQSEGVIRSDRPGGGGGGGNALSIFSLFPLHTWFVSKIPSGDVAAAFLESLEEG